MGDSGLMLTGGSAEAALWGFPPGDTGFRFRSGIRTSQLALAPLGRRALKQCTAITCVRQSNVPSFREAIRFHTLATASAPPRLR